MTPTPPQPIALWPDVTGPGLTPYLHETEASLPLVLVLPGGGYARLAPHEAEPVARRLNAAGFHAAVLRYRVGEGMHHPMPLHDAQRAVRFVRDHAALWRVDPRAIGVVGFSAGGHLAACLAVHHDRWASEHDDLADRFSARPDAAVLCYPVITLVGPSRHAGSAERLLGNRPDPELAELLSVHTRVTERTPPAFLWHTADDASVPVGNSLMFAQACAAHRVPFELHVFPSGRHGLGLAESDDAVRPWFDLATAFLGRQLRRP